MALKGRTAAIVGYGGIGQEVAKRLSGFEMKILAVSRRGPKSGEVAGRFPWWVKTLCTKYCVKPTLSSPRRRLTKKPAVYLDRLNSPA